MTVNVLRLMGVRHQCRECMTIIPADRELCYFHSRPRRPEPVREDRLEHVRRHMREQDRPFLDYLLQPLTFDEIAAEMGEGWTVRQVERAWYATRLRFGFEGTPHRQKGHLERLALLRVAVGLAPCFCGR